MLSFLSHIPCVPALDVVCHSEIYKLETWSQGGCATLCNLWEAWPLEGAYLLEHMFQKGLMPELQSDLILLRVGCYKSGHTTYSMHFLHDV